MNLRHAARDWLDSGEPAVLVEVSEAQGSVPRGSGTRMLVSAQRAAGTIGGGHLELKALAHARRMLEQGDLSVSSLHLPLGPALGQCCGGAVTLRFERLQATHLGAWPLSAPLFHLQLYGAGHVGRAIARLLAMLDVQVDWIDEREDEFPASLGDVTWGAWPAHIRKLVGDGVEAEVRHAPPGAFYLVLTHQHDLDLRITEAILRRGDFRYLGLIGSRTKKNKFIHRFEALGLAPALIERITCPIGVPGIAGKEPEVIAVAVVAQLLQRASAQAVGKVA
ncbi:MAG TPA: xanthine dehydrogenase accessory protein XdhC [Rhizobacter sp.]|nr:xanthine dehydrogenase accessory protein XdhC [Rhizobacter sp.]